MKSSSTKITEKLMFLGLTEREAKLYLTLLSKKSFTAMELQSVANIPRTKIYEVFQKLLAKGLCTYRIIGKTKYYEANDPNLALQKLIEEEKIAFDERFEKIKSSTSEILKIVTPLYEKSKNESYPYDFVEIFRNKEQIQKKYLQAVNESKKALLTFNKGPYVCDTPGRLKEQEDAETQLIKRGIECRNIYERKELEQYEWLSKYVKRQSLLGQQARVTDELPIKMMVFDEKRVFFPLLHPGEDSNNSFTMIFIEHRELAIACKMLFDHIWNNSKEVSVRLVG